MVMPMDSNDRERYRLECEARAISQWPAEKRAAYLSRLEVKGLCKRLRELRIILNDMLDARYEDRGPKQNR